MADPWVEWPPASWREVYAPACRHDWREAEMFYPPYGGDATAYTVLFCVRCAEGRVLRHAALPGYATPLPLDTAP